MTFSYKAIDKNGQTVYGSYEAGETSQVVSFIKAQHMTPIKVTEGKSADLDLSAITPKPQARDLAMFCEQFCSLIRAGVTILDSLKMLAEQTKDVTLKKGVQATVTGINAGESLGDSMAKTPKAFNETFVSLVRAGEASGSLDVSLERLASQYKKDAEIKAAVTKALIYPIVVLVVAVGVVIFMLLVIVPKFMEIFETIGMELPGITQAVVNMSKWVQEFWWIALLIIIGIVIAIILFKQSKVGKKCFSWLSIRIPFVNDLVIKSNSSKIARTMSTLLSAGMSIIDTLNIVENTVKNVCYKEAVAAVREEVLVGHPMSSKMNDYPREFPKMLTHMVAVGEDVGDMSTMLSRTADYYDLQVETAVSTLMSLLQPTIILLLACIVGVLVAAVIAPMVSLYSDLGDVI